MNNIFSSIGFLVENIVLPVILSTVATIIYTIKNGWRGIRNFFATWCIACFAGVCASWGIAHLNYNPSLNALIISMTALLSHLILDVIFHPEIRNAIRRRIVNEISERGRGASNGAKKDEN